MHILILGDVESVVNYMDFFENSYSIITSEYEYRSISPAIKYAAKAIYTLKTSEEFDATCFEKNIDQIFLHVDQIIKHVGDIHRVVATHEHTVLPSAMIRTRYSINGLQEEQAVLLRNKTLMKSRINCHGISTPYFDCLTESQYENKIVDAIAQFGTIVIKPVDQAGSSGILITDDATTSVAHVANLLRKSVNVTLEQYIHSPIMHFDGVVWDGEIIFLSVTKKIGNCYRFVHEQESLASIIVNDEQVYHDAREYVRKCLSALDITFLVFHLEVFEEHTGEYVFLEIAGRYPGAGITNLIKMACGFDFVKAGYEVDCLFPFKASSNRTIHKINPTAMLLIPLPEKSPVIIRGMTGMDNLPNNIIGSEFCGPGTEVRYTSIDAFQSLARISIADDNITAIEETIHQITSQMRFLYE